MITMPEKTNTEQTDLASAIRTIDSETDTINKLKETLSDGSLTRALDTMQKSKGRIIVTGMGKSGHIGKKIAASLASTGTPSFFVHPAEASHGDLGMITEDDGGTRTSWKCSAIVKIASKSYGFEINLPFNTRDDIVWRGQLSRRYLEANDNITGHFGDVDLTFELVEY